MDYTVDIVREPGRDLAVTRFDASVAGIGAQLGAALGTVAQHLGRHGLAPSGPAVARYEPRPDGFAVAAGFVVGTPLVGDDEVVPLRLPTGEMATTTHVGAYADLSRAYDAIRSAMADKGRRLDESQMWEEYWSGPDTPPEQTRTVVLWPLAPA
ncbi:MAG: GyrI-like domain-containing protein [Nocardioidaceae bacterium]